MALGRKSRQLGKQSATQTLRLKERLMSVTDDFWVEDEDGERKYKVKGKLISYRDTWTLLDADGTEAAIIREKKISVRDSMTIEIGNSTLLLKKALVGLRDRFNISANGMDDISIKGDIISKEYTMHQNGEMIATVSRKWFRVRDSYGVRVAERTDPALAIAIAVGLDSLTT